MITKEQALKLSYQTEIYHATMRNADKSPLRARVNGKCKTWARQSARFQLPIKHGLRDCGYLNETNCDEWYLSESEAREAGIVANDPRQYLIAADIEAAALRKQIAARDKAIREASALAAKIAKTYKMRIDLSKPCEPMVGANYGIVRQIVNRQHVSMSIREVLRKCRPSRMRQQCTVELRRGWLLTALEAIAESRQLYRDVMSGNVG